MTWILIYLIVAYITLAILAYKNVPLDLYETFITILLSLLWPLTLSVVLFAVVKKLIKLLKEEK